MRLSMKGNNPLNLKLEDSASNAIDYAYCFVNATNIAYDLTTGVTSKAAILNDIILNNINNEETIYKIGRTNYTLKEVYEVCHSLKYFIEMFVEYERKSNNLERDKIYNHICIVNGTQRLDKDKIEKDYFGDLCFLCLSLDTYILEKKYQKSDNKKNKDNIIYTYISDVILDYIIYDKFWIIEEKRDAYGIDIYDDHKIIIMDFYKKLFMIDNHRFMLSSIINMLIKEMYKDSFVELYSSLDKFIDLYVYAYKDDVNIEKY